MHVLIVYAHPSENSFTYQVLQSFIRGLEMANHSFDLSDLYKMGFKTDLDMEEYIRESGAEPTRSIPQDVREEQEKIDRAEVLVFIYPVWWSDCPAKLKGWFDRVYTLGYAYSYDNACHSNGCFKVRKAIALCPAGHPVEYLEEIGIAESMRKVMLKDRLLGVGAEEAQMVILGGMVSSDPKVRQANLEIAFRLGRNLK